MPYKCSIIFKPTDGFHNSYIYKDSREVRKVFSKNAIRVLEKRYLLRNDQGEVIETPEDMVRRVARCVAAADEKWGLDEKAIDQLANTYHALMTEGQFLPNSPTLMNAGKADGQLSACFVLPVPDDLEGIFETCKHAALIHKTGGGTGFSFSRLRPYQDPVASSIGVASGPVSFMGVYDAATEAIRQGGTRRGANMGILRIDHPDIESFITCKRDTKKLNNFNISVAITDTFMEALEADKPFDLIHPVSGKTIRTVQAKALFDQIVENAHDTGEPGIVFIDRINNLDPMIETLDETGLPIAGTEDIEATNPCGEQPLGPGDACNLGSINISKFVSESGENRYIDYDALRTAIYTAVRFLDGVIEVNRYPLQFVARATLNNRRIGLGLMGWADTLILLGIAYDSEEALEKADELMSFFQKEAHKASIKLAEERGVFPNWPHSTWKEKGIRLRNATVTTIAPTGTISILADASSGIEPLFALSYLRRVLGGEELIEINPLFQKIAREKGFYSEALMDKIAESGTLEGIEEVPDEIKRLFVCSHQISFDWHVKMQAAFQKHTDNAVSKTINFPNHATLEEVERAYLMAWDLGLKGITVYRDGTRDTQVLNISASDPLKKEDKTAKKSLSPVSAGTAECIPVSIDEGHTKTESKLVSAGAGQSTNRSGRARGFRQEPSYHKGVPCPECGSSFGSMMKFEACLLCPTCGYTKC